MPPKPDQSSSNGEEPIKLDFDRLSEQAYNAYLKDKPSVIALDTETEGLGWFDPAFCATVSWGAGGHYIELTPRGRHFLSLLLRSAGRWVFHNAKFDLQKLLLGGVISRSDFGPDRIEDTEAMAHLLDAHQKKSLKPLAAKYLGANIDEAKRMRKLRKKYKLTKADGLHKLPREEIYNYAVLDAEFTLGVFESLEPHLAANENLSRLYEWEMELTLVLLDMEAQGMAVDLDYVESSIKSLNGSILRCEFSMQDETGLKVWYPPKPGAKQPEGCLNPNSPAQNLVVLEKRGIKVKSTKNDALKPYKDDSFVALLLEARKHKKNRDYFLAIKEEQRDGIIHPHIRQHAAKTGRTGSGKAQDG